MYKLISFQNIHEGIVTKRPSLHIKSPYVADVLIEDDNFLCHTPSLGCCGLADKQASVLLVKKSPDKKTKCSHSIYFSKYSEHNKNSETIICIYPKLAENIVEICLQNNYFSILQNIKKYEREKVVKIQDNDEFIVNSRFDFAGIDENNNKFLLEIKSVPLADYEDLNEKQKKTIKKNQYIDRKTNTKVAYFPDGYRKNKEDTISPRALKHIQELLYLKKYHNYRSILCYVIQRSDVNRFQPSVVDPIYRKAFIEAIDNGVEIITLVIDWKYDNIQKSIDGYFVRDNLPIFLDD
jgi:DNA-binding sugar fermentation-stimulating protein